MPHITPENVWWFIAVYIAIAIVNYGRLYPKYGPNGPDGLIPLFGAIFWLPILPFVIIYAIGKCLFNIGKTLS